MTDKLPPEVIEASRRLEATAYKPTQSIPPLFQEIIRNDAEIDAWRDDKVVPFETGCRTLARKRELIRSAETALSWNTDKGN